MGNQHSGSHALHKPRKNVHWKSAGRPAAPGKPEIKSALIDDEPNAITLQWAASPHDGGAPLLGYQVECNRVGTVGWIRTAPPLVHRPELLLTGLEPPHHYQFRVAAQNAVGRSEYSEPSDILHLGSDRTALQPPIFLQHLEDVTALENDKTEFRVAFNGVPHPTIAWFKDGYEIFSSRRTAITTDDTTSVLVFHQTLPTDEGEIKCTATNRTGHAVTKAKLSLEAAPKLRYPRQYEDGLLYEINETIFLKTNVVGKPTPTIEWRHDGELIAQTNRVEITNTPKFSVLKINSARRSDRGEYQIYARNGIGEDTASFLVTVTAPPEPPRRVSVTRQVDKSVTLDWEPPDDDGGCRIGNYVVEYFRSGWDVWLKATTSRKTNVTLFDLIEGSEYRFRVKAESPYGVSAPSEISAPVRIPGRPVDMEFLAVESRIINQVLLREDGEEPRVSPAPRRKRMQQASARAAEETRPKDPAGSNEFMLVLYPDVGQKADDKAEKRKSFQLDLEDALSPPPISLSAPELSSRCTLPFKSLRNAVSSTELLHERAMARFYKAVAMKEEQDAKKQRDNANKLDKETKTTNKIDIPRFNDTSDQNFTKKLELPNVITVDISPAPMKPPEIYIKSELIESENFKYVPKQPSQDSDYSDNKWQNVSFEEDYTASTVSSADEEYSDEGSFIDEIERSQYASEEETYNPRNKPARPSSVNEFIVEEEEESEREIIKPLPLPDPNFIPKPILKKRETDQLAILNEKEKTLIASKEKPKKEEKLTLLKKITKMPIQKPFPFPKILNKKEKLTEVKPDNLPKTPDKVNDIDEKVSDEGRTVIDYYSNIVKEYGGQKKPTKPLYLNTEDLKIAAEKQQGQEQEKKEATDAKTKKQSNVKIGTKSTKKAVPKTKKLNSVDKPANSKQIPNRSKRDSEKKVFGPSKNQDQKDKTQEDKKYTQQILLKKTERATIVIPIDYKELEEKAKENVRSAIDYTVDICLLLLAFWVYFFKDERLAIPFLILIIYRQLQETFLFNIPEWIKRHTPEWLKKKNS